MGQSRLEGISKIVFPTNIKGMQRFLGATRYVADFIPNYSALSASLCDMTAKAFDWNPKTWTQDYESTFTKCKEAILQAQTLYLPDYSLQWILRPDASTFAVGAVLVQLKPTEADPTIFQEQILSLTSKKLSPSARNWATIKAEAYAIYFAITSNEYFLRGKFFTVETDHANLVWIEKSVESMIVRWRAILRVYNFRIRHIKGELNVMADMLSRMYHTDHSIELVADDPSPAVSAVAVEEVPVTLSQEECLIQAHTGARFHRGASATYEALNKYFPGHGIPYALVNDYVKRCGICAKVRTGLQTTLVPITRNLQLPRNRRAVGWDDLTITPVDEYGNSNLSVFVDLTTGQTALYPRKDHSADSLLDNLFCFYATYGKYDEIHTDPGSDICSQAVELLNAWFGVTHQTSLVDVHTSNGVENTNGRILRFLRTMVAEFGIKKKWSKPSILYAIQFHLNDFLNSEFGIRPFDATFGTDSGAYFLLPTSLPPHVASNERLKLLNDDLRLVRELSYKHKAKVTASRLPSNPISQNKFQPGDLVLYHVAKPRVSKLSPVYAGPFEVLSHYQNDVSCRHLVLHYVEKFHVDKLGMFHGTPEDGFKMALLDRDQHVVLLIDAHRGVPSRRTGMEFGTRFADGDYIWLPYSTDIASTEAFEKYCKRLTELQFLLITVKEAQIRVKLLNTNVIPAIPTTEFFLDLRYFGEKYYDDFQDTTADAYSRRYFFLARFGQFQDTRHIKISVLIPLRKQTAIFNGYAYALYGTQKELPPDGVLVDAEFSKHTPCVLSK
jgi:RNase H-like domain found in reverse transcriptase